MTRREDGFHRADPTAVWLVGGGLVLAAVAAVAARLVDLAGLLMAG